MDDQGRDVTNPWRMPLGAWIAVAKRTWAETTSDNVGLIAAGVAFYGFLASVPMLGAIVLVYGIVAEPATVMHDMAELTSIMPADVAKLVGEQLMNIVKTSDGKKGVGVLLALALAVFGARNGAGAIITALNIAYEEEEKRGFLKVNLLAIGMTAVAVAVAMLALMAIAALGHLESLIPNAPSAAIVSGKIAAYLLLTLAGAGAAATLYRYGPSRERADWVWLTPGSVFAALTWLLLTIVFGIYVAKLGNYNATYGSLSAVVVTLTWLYFSSYILLFGAELNSELEHQTAQDTIGTAAPMGARGAWMADHIAGTESESVILATPRRAPPSAQARRNADTTLRGNLVASRVAARALVAVRLPQVGWMTSVAATAALSLLRWGKGGPGVALLGAAAALMWFRRDHPKLSNRLVKAVFFDIDGTLVDSNEHHVSAWHDAFRAAKLSVERHRIREQIGKGGDLLIPALVPEVSEDVRRTVSAHHDEIFQRRHLKQVEPFPDAVALLRRVHDSGREIVLATSASSKEVTYYLSHLAIDKLVIATTSIDDIKTSKPAGDIYAAALAKVSALRADDVVAVGDTPYDIAGAKKCGIGTIAVRSGGFDDKTLLEAGAIALYDDIASLLADYERSPLNR